MPEAFNELNFKLNTETALRLRRDWVGDWE